MDVLCTSLSYQIHVPAIGCQILTNVPLPSLLLPLNPYNSPIMEIYARCFFFHCDTMKMQGRVLISFC